MMIDLLLSSIGLSLIKDFQKKYLLLNPKQVLVKAKVMEQIVELKKYK